MAFLSLCFLPFYEEEQINALSNYFSAVTYTILNNGMCFDDLEKHYTNVQFVTNITATNVI